MKNIFLGSVGRSGTSILARVISQVPKTLYFQESRIFTDNDSLKGLLTARISEKKFRHNMLNMYRLKTISNLRHLSNINKVYSINNIRKALQTNNIITSIQNFYRLGLVFYKRDILIDKTPHNCVVTHLINLVFPNCKFIIISRDPRDVYSSILTKSWGPKTPQDFVVWYNNIVENSERSLAMINKENKLFVKFEDLIYNKEEKLQEIFKFLKLEYKINYGEIITEEKAHIGRYKRDLKKIDADYIQKNCKQIGEIK